MYKIIVVERLLRDYFRIKGINCSSLSYIINRSLSYNSIRLFDMKVKQIVELKPLYSFEAPVVPAAIIKAYKIGKKDIEHTTIDLNKHLAPNPDSTFLVKVSGESMIDESIYDGDILIVDKADTANDGQVVIAALNGEMAVKSYRVIDGTAYLFSANNKFLPIEIMPFWEFRIQGIVKHIIHCV